MRWSRIWLLLAVLLQAAPGAAVEPVRVYGLELESRGERQRLLVFAEEPVEPALIEADDRTLILSLPGAILDPSAPRRVLPAEPGPVSRVTAFDRADVETPEVRVVITRQPGAAPQLSQRGAILALDFAGPGAPDPGIVLQYRDAEIAKVVRDVAKATGERFLFDDQLRGHLTLIAPDRLSRREALEMLHTALLVTGFAAVPSPGGPLKILPIDGVTASAPYDWHPLVDTTDAPITTLVRLETADAEDLASQLQPWIGKSALVEAFAPTNSLILAGSENRLTALLQMVRALDSAAQDLLIVRRLRHARAADVADQLSEIYGDGHALAARFQVSTDERGNRLVIRAPTEWEAELRERLLRLDRPLEAHGNIDVIRLRYVDPEHFGQLLGEIASGQPGKTVGAVSGRELRGRSFNFSIDPASRSLVVEGDPATLTLVRDLVDELDRVPPRISVEVLVLELTTNGSLELGFDAIFRTIPTDDLAAEIALDPTGGGLIQPDQGTTSGGAARVTSDPLMFPIVDADGNPTNVLLPSRSFVITADQSEIEGRLLLRPHLLVASGEEQQIFVGDNIPVTVANNTAQGNVFQTRTDVQRYDVGTTLRVRPTLGEQGVLQLDLRVETSQLGPPVAGDPNVVGPSILQRTLESHLYLGDGQWAVVGLGHDTALQTREVGTPFLKDVPVLGTFFRSTRDLEMTTQLVIAVQARVQRSPEEAEAETIRRRLGFERSLARTLDLRKAEDGPVVLLVTTRESRAEAEALAESFPADAHPARVVAWEYAGLEHFDVYLTRFGSIAAAGEAAGPLAVEGWSPQIVVVPGAEPGSSTLHMRPPEPEPSRSDP
jgi:general secretion pathway protein D